MRFLLSAVSTIFLGMLCALQGDEPVASEVIRAKLDVIPKSPKVLGSDLPLIPQAQGIGKLPDDGRAALLRTHEGEWKTFSDELISFEYPDEPTLRVIPTEDDPTASVVPGAVGNADRSFSRAYRLVTGANVPYLTIFLQETTVFDDGICFCGEIVFEQIVPVDGTILRFSYLRNGHVKKVQALGARHRAIALEWTHTSITQDAFARIGRSLRLKERTPLDRAAWIEKIGSPFKPWGLMPRSRLHERLAWIQNGMSEAELRALLGEPTQKQKGAWLYEEVSSLPDGHRRRFKARVPVKEGRFTQFDRDWMSQEELPADRGTLRWVEQLLTPNIAFDLPKERRIKPTPALVRVAVKAFLEQAEARNAEDWARWCEALKPEDGRPVDPRIVARIESCFLDVSRDQRAGLAILVAAKSTKLPELALGRAKQLLDPANEAKAKETFWEVPTLLEAVGDTAEAQDLARAACKDPRPLIRTIGVESAKILPVAERKAVVVTALEDPDLGVRQRCAYGLRFDTPDLLDAVELSRLIDKQTDVRTRARLQEVLKSVQREKQ